MEGPDVGACALEIKRAFPNVPMVVKLHTPGALINKVSNTYQPLFTKLRFVAGALRRGGFNLGYWSKKSSNKEKDHEYQVCKLADILLSPSRALKEWASRYWCIPAGKIDVIPNPFVFSEALLQLPLDNRPRQISFIGKLSVLKGMVALTGSIPAILDQFPGYRVCLVGRDELENGLSMKQYMQDKLSNYAGRIEFTGALSAEALVTIYANSQVCIFPSLWENYPTVLLEAMASGAAIAASNRGGIPEMIEDGVTGKLFDPMDPKKIIQAVSELLRDETNRLEMAARARQYLQQQQGNRLFEEKILEPYTRLALTCSHV